MPVSNTKEVEKQISFKIAQQFPAIYRENNDELVSLVTDYYKFLETTPNQHVYNTRRLFEYRDITTTLSSMILFFQKKFLADLPLLEDTSVRLVVKNILDLYRRKGSSASVVLFFRMFYQEDVEIFNPSKYVLKPSNSKWQTGNYLQMIPNNGLFYDRSGEKYYEYSDLLGKTVIGSVSKAQAAVDKINFVLLNNTLTPILYLSNLKGTFKRYDDIVARIDSKDVSFGVLNGSASDITIDLDYGGTTGNNIGDEVYIKSDYGVGGVALVTDTEDEFTGIVDYTLTDGGFGYTIANTRLEVSNQVVILNNEDLSFTPLERLVDSGGNQGTVIGQNSSAVGVKMDVGESFAIGRTISTLDRTPNIDIEPVFSISDKNETSPGPLYPDTSANTDVKVETLSNIETIALITDPIAPFLGVTINAANYNVAPATQPMSGTADPVTLSTPLEDAFDLTPFEIGTIDAFENINPGEDYVNDVFTLVRDEVMIAFDRYEQRLIVSPFSAAFSVGDTITQPSTSVSGIITGINVDRGFIQVRPYAYYGFRTAPINHEGTVYTVIATERDYTTDVYGANAEMTSRTQFATGRISEVRVTNSGFGYLNKEIVFLTNAAGQKLAKGQLFADSQGITAGFWGSETSHVNGYKQDGTYYDSQNRVHDSDFYQEYSYQIKSTVDFKEYEETLKQNIHLAGTRIFGAFSYKKKQIVGVTAKFGRTIKNDPLIGGDPIVGPDQSPTIPRYSSDRTTITVDTVNLKVDTV
jgi:hypothetical protein